MPRGSFPSVRASCLFQSSDLNVHLTHKQLHRNTQNNVWANIWVPSGTMQLTYTISHHGNVVQSLSICILVVVICSQLVSLTTSLFHLHTAGIIFLRSNLPCFAEHCEPRLMAELKMLQYKLRMEELPILAFSKCLLLRHCLLQPLAWSPIPQAVWDTDFVDA